MQYRIERISNENYDRFADMLYWREAGQERTPAYETADAKVRAELENPNLYVYALEAEGRYVGWISLVYIPKVSKWKGYGHVYVDELWVAPQYRGQGFAKALMKKADELCAQLTASGIRLYVNTQNGAAERLYRACGYHEGGRAVFMEKTESR